MNSSSGEGSGAWVVRASTAIFGFSLAIALEPRLQVRARPTDMLSALKVAGYSPTGLLLQFGLAVILTAGFAILGNRAAALLAGYRWAIVSYCAALFMAPVALMYFGDLRHVVLIGTAGATIVAIRRRDPHFTIGDVLLIPTLLSCYIAFLDLGFGHTPIATFLRASIAVFGLRLLVRSSDAIVASPLALMAQIGGLRLWIGAAIALVVIFATPFFLARMERRLPRKIVYPLVVFLYPLAVVRVPSRITKSDFFEDGHHLVVATEMMRGERPYSDIIPTHGLIYDGALDFVAMKLGARSLRAILDTRLVAGVLSAVAIYCAVLAATGSAEIAFVGAFLAFSLSSGSTIWLRPSGGLFALAATVAATRLRSRRWFMAAGALVVVAYLVSVDYGVYSVLVALLAALRARALRPLAIGMSAAAIAALALFAVFGFAIDFIRVNVVEIFGGHSVGYVGPLAIPDCLRSPAIVHHLAGCLDPIVWVIALITGCVALGRSPLRARRSDAPWLIGIWIVVAAAAFVRRGNFQFNPAVTAFIVAALWVLSRYARTLAAVLAVIVVLLAEPLRHVITVVPQVRRVRQEPLFDPITTASIRAAGRFTATLKPDETFVDFSNSALLYSILGRHCPLRQAEVPDYQAEDAQRQVIGRIEGNRHVRAALITFPGTNQNVDGIPNNERAPLVWAYLRRNFAPAFEQDGVVFWKRIR